MPYQKEISREFPTCFVFLLDQSGSMADSFGRSESGISKAQGLADTTNRLMQNLLIRCESKGEILNRYHIGLVGYGGTVKPAFVGNLAGRTLVSMQDLYENPARVEERMGSESEGDEGMGSQAYKLPVWVDPVCYGGTPMAQALSYAKDVVEGFVQQHPDSFPPIVFNLTDGESTDGDPSKAARELAEIATNDGNVLLFNLHISSRTAAPIEFPDSDTNLPDEFAKLLFSMSSLLPEHIREATQEEGHRVSPQTRGFAFNADMASVIKFLRIGTIPSNMR